MIIESILSIPFISAMLSAIKIVGMVAIALVALGVTLIAATYLYDWTKKAGWLLFVLVLDYPVWMSLGAFVLLTILLYAVGLWSLTTIQQVFGGLIGVAISIGILLYILSVVDRRWTK